MTPEEQLDKWVNGEPLHNDERDECCPDFSCCTGIISDESERIRFSKAVYEGDDTVKMEMLMMFLGRALKNEAVYIADLNGKGCEH